MTERFVDTSYWLALLLDADEWHGQAVQLGNVNRYPLVTTQWVLIELVNSMTHGYEREQVARFLKKIETTPGITVLEGGAVAFRSGMGMFEKAKDKEWSLTDCISFNVMRERAITEAFTNDHHFEQAGFIALLK